MIKRMRQGLHSIGSGPLNQKDTYKVRCDIQVTATSIRTRDNQTRHNKQGKKSMKYVKVIVGLGLIPLGVFVGSYITIGAGNGTIIGGIIGGFLWCVINWSGPKGNNGFWPHTYSPDEQHQVNNNVNKQGIDNTVRSVEQAHIEDQIRHSREHYFF